jgi:hypothetical protein
MVVKAQKWHGAKSGLYSGCSNGVPPIHLFQAEQRNSIRMSRWFVMFSGMERSFVCLSPMYGTSRFSPIAC